MICTKPPINYAMPPAILEGADHGTQLCRDCLMYNGNVNVSCQKYNMITKWDATCKSWRKKNEK